MRELCLAAPQRLTVQDHVPGMCHLFVHQAGDGHGMACAVFNCTYAISSALRSYSRSVLHVSQDLTRLLTVGPLSQEEMLIPRYTAFDSHDGPVVMLTCQGFWASRHRALACSLRSSTRRQRWRRIRKP
jgi:hypothetical protein